MPIPQAVEDLRGLVDDAVLVGEEAIARGMKRKKLLYRHAGVVAEPSAVVGVAALLERPAEFRGRTVGTVVCGGNLTVEQVGRWL